MLLLICVEGLLYAGLSSLYVLSQWNLGLYEPKAHRGILEPSGIESPGTVCLSMVEDQNQGWTIHSTVRSVHSFTPNVKIVIQ